VPPNVIGAVSFKAMLNRPERAKISAEKNQLAMEGVLDSGVDGKDGVSFTANSGQKHTEVLFL